MYISHSKGYKIVNKIRFFIFLTILALIIFTLLLSFKVNAKDASDFNIKPIYVSTGDTLWCISEKYAPKNMDIRIYLDNIMQFNELNSVIISPGQILYIPIYNN